MSESILSMHDFTPEAYPAITRVSNAVYTEYPSSEEEIRFRDDSRDPKCLFHRWVAAWDGAIVGYGQYDQHSMMYHPRKFSFEVLVLPELEGRGIGRALYERVVESLAALDPIMVRSMIKEDKSSGVRFLTRRGFEEDRRLWESRLDPSLFDLTPYEGHVESILNQGIEIRTYRELQGDPEFLRKLADLDWEATQDVPMSDPPTRMPDEVYNRMISENPGLLPDAFFIALDQGKHVGVSNLWSSQGNSDLYTGFTGTARAYRHRGIAFALKLKAIAWAKEHGNICLKTWNDSTNRPMLAINEGLGFVRQPAWVVFQKRLAEETS